MYIRDIIFGQDTSVGRPIDKRRLIMILSFVFLVAVAWRYGIISAGALALKTVGIVVWSMFRDLAAGLGDFLQYILSQRQ